MNLAIVSTTMILTLVLLVGRESTQAEELLGQQLRLTGQWIEDRFKAMRVRPWETKEDPQRGRVADNINSVNADTRTLRVGPILVEWNEATQFEEISLQDLAPGRVIEASGQIVGPTHLIAKSIAAEFMSPHHLEIRGTVTDEERQLIARLAELQPGIPADGRGKGGGFWTKMKEALGA